jgi:hypothetical protein
MYNRRRLTIAFEWTPAAILPNLFADKAVEGEVIALAPRSDPRVQGFCAAHPNFEVLLSRFTDAFHVELDPVVLIVRDDVLPKLAHVEPLASFRDLVALCVIPYCRSLAVVYRNPHHISYSNSFSFYPWMLGTDNEHLIATTPAMTALHVVEEFHGQSAPELPSLQLSELDEPLFNALLRRWKRYYLGKGQRWQDRALFRSLNMATQAAQLPASIDTTFYDLGRMAALWVSAFEILAHPRTANSGLKSVYPLFECISFCDRHVGRRRYTAYMGRIKKPWPRRSLPGWLYGKLYQARCAFLHGGPVRTSLLSPANSKVGLFWLAPSLFRLALTGFVDLSFKKSIPKDPQKLGKYIADKMQFTKYQKTIERALLRARR